MEQQNGPFYLKFKRWKQRPDQTVQVFIQKVQIKSKLIDLPEDQVLILFFTSTQQSFSYAGRFFLGLTSTKLG